MLPSLVSLQNALFESERVRSFALTAVVVAALVALTDFPVSAGVVLLTLSAGAATVEVADDAYGLPDGTTELVYGGLLVAVGVGFVVTGAGHLAGAVFVLAGGWFALDAATAIRYGTPRERHDYVAGIGDDRSEFMLRTQVMGSVYHRLRDADRPRTVEELAVDLDLTESRVRGALDYLEAKGKVAPVGDDCYRATPPRWGRLAPVAKFAVWLPRRLVRPATRVLGRRRDE